MATVCLHTAGSGVSRPSLSCTTKGFAGWKLQSSGSFCIANPNLKFESCNKVRKSIQSGKPTRGTVKMMAMSFGAPVVTYLDPYSRTPYHVDLWNAFYRKRIVWIGEYINDERSNDLVGLMLYIDCFDSSQRMFFVINAGGDIFPSLSVYDTMGSLKSPVGTHCPGLAPNMGGFLVSAGDKGNRTAGACSTIQLDSPTGTARGRVDEVVEEVSALVTVRDYLFKQLADKTGQPIEKIYEDITRRKSFSAQEAVEYGLIDRIVGKNRSPN